MIKSGLVFFREITNIFLLLLFVTFFISCDKDNKPELPENLTASQGTYVGVIHLANSHVDKEKEYHRFNENTASWEGMGLTWANEFDDNGFPQGLVPGKEYRYKMRVHKDGEYSEFSNEVTGYTFKAEPTIITSINFSSDNNSKIIHWENPNDLSHLQNLSGIYYDIYKRDNQHSSGFTNIHTEHDGFNNYQTDFSFEDYNVDEDGSYSYKIITRYQYNFHTIQGNFYSDFYEVDHTSAGHDNGDNGDNGNGDNGENGGEPGDGVIDIDGYDYSTVIIGEQEWMAENLRVTHYDDGTEIPLVTDGNTWLNLTSGAFTWYENDENYKDTYGNLYNWYAVTSGNLCPAGWKVPSEADWTQLINYLGGTEVAGGKLKATGTIEQGNGLWDSPNDFATNESGFTGLPGGVRHSSLIFTDMGNMGYFWSTDERSEVLARRYRLHSYMGSIEVGEGEKIEGKSVRCIKE